MKQIKFEQLLAPWCTDLLEQVIALDGLAFPFPNAKKDWVNFDKQDNYYLFVVSNKGELLGFALYYMISSEKLAHLLKIVVSPNYINKGFGGQLLRFSFNKLRSLDYQSCFLEVEDDNLSAIKLYSGQKFEKVGIAKNFYGNGRNALRMLHRITI